MKQKSLHWGGLAVQLLEPDVPDNVTLNVVLCHGFGAPGSDLVPLAPMIVKFDRSLAEQVRFLFPEAPLDLEAFGMPDGRAWWNLDLWKLQAAIAAGTYGDLTRRTPEGLPAARQMFQQFLEECERETGIPVSRTVLGGFSQGAMLSTDVSLHLATPPGGLIVLSGSLINHDEWAKLLAGKAGMPVFQSHGKYDPVLPFEVAVQLRDELESAGNPVEFCEFPGAHEIPFEVMKLVTEFLAQRVQA